MYLLLIICEIKNFLHVIIYMYLFICVHIQYTVVTCALTLFLLARL